MNNNKKHIKTKCEFVDFALWLEKIIKQKKQSKIKVKNAQNV